jgi:hypothetical protein
MSALTTVAVVATRKHEQPAKDEVDPQEGALPPARAPRARRWRRRIRTCHEPPAA